MCVLHFPFLSHITIDGFAQFNHRKYKFNENWLWIYWYTRRIQQKVNKRNNEKILFGWQILKLMIYHYWCICSNTFNSNYEFTNKLPNRYLSKTTLISSTIVPKISRRPSVVTTTATATSMATKMANSSLNIFHENAEYFLKQNNISINNLNITSENFNDFLKKLVQLSKPVNMSGINAHSNEHDSCDDYCKGFIQDIFGTYRNIHGYLSLLVSIYYIFKFYCSQRNHLTLWTCEAAEQRTLSKLIAEFWCILKVCIFGTIANILNIIVLTRKDMNKTPINTLLKWLAVADMFVMIEYIPFTIYMYIFPGNFYWIFFLIYRPRRIHHLHSNSYVYCVCFDHSTMRCVLRREVNRKTLNRVRRDKKKNSKRDM